MPTQVLHVIARMNVGGTARYVSELVEKIPDNKLATGYVQGSEIEDPCVQKLNVLRVPHMGRKISPFNDFRAWLELRKIIKEIKPVIVHTHTFKAGLIGRLIGGKHTRVHTFHGHLFDDNSFSTIAKKAIIFAEKFLARRTDLLISVGQKVGVELRSAGIGVDQNWSSIPPGVQPLQILDQRSARKALGVSSDAFLIGWMGRMAEVKNPLMFLEVANKLKELNFVMAGGGSMLVEVQNKAPKNVRVLGWVDATTFWSAVNCGVSTSNNEGMPVALIEAQLAGVPVVATNAGSSSEVIEDRVTGFITPKNVDKIAEAIKRIFSDDSLRNNMVQSSKTRAKHKFSLDQMIKLHAMAYTQIQNSAISD